MIFVEVLLVQMKPPETRAHSSRHNIEEESQQGASAEQDVLVEEDGRINYYPKCDAKIWLRSCTQEVINPLHGEKSGTIPDWLSGSLIRNGPGRIKVGQDTYNHLFDGSALLHRFHFDNGEVTYQNRFLKSRSYVKDTEAQRIVVNYFGTRAHPDPCRSILKNITSKFSMVEQFSDNAQISLYPYGDGLYALTETPFMYRVNPQTLETHQKVDMYKYVSIFTHTAHPHVEDDGSVYNIGQGVGPTGPRYHICKFPKGENHSQGNKNPTFKKAKIVASVNARWSTSPCYMHSFAATPNYWVVIEQPMVVSLPKIIKVAIDQEAFIDALQWKEKETLFHVVDRRTGNVIKTSYVTETFFFLHIINAYEEDNHIVMDIAAYKNADMLHCMYVESLKDASYDPTYAEKFRGRPKRWVLPLKVKRPKNPDVNLISLPNTKCTAKWIGNNKLYLNSEILSNIGCEVPRIWYEKYNGRPYKYFYAICSDVDHQPNPGCLVKVDVEHKTHIEWSLDNIYPSEPIFVPKPDAKDEDDGLVLSALLRAEGHKKEICLVVLDAKNMKELGRVEFVTPSEVPKDLHGWFVNEGSLMGRPLTTPPTEEPVGGGAAEGAAEPGSSRNTKENKKKTNGSKSKIKY